MTVRTVVAGGGAWRFAPDQPPPAVAERSQTMLQARLVDEVLLAPPVALPSVATTVHGAIARASGGGRIGVVGRPAQVFFAPMIALATLDISVAAPGFLPLRLEQAAGPQPGYPDAFAAVDLGDVALHRAPVAVAGRVVSRALGPLAGAALTVTGVWPVMAPPLGPASAPNAMPALAGLYADRPIGGQLRRRNFAPAAELKALVRPAVAGDRTVMLSDMDTIAAGQVLMIDFGDDGRVEFVGITSIKGASSPDQPAEFTLDLPLRRDHAEGVGAARACSGPAGAVNAIARDARVGDVSVWTGGLAGIAAGTRAIEITGGAAATEYHATRRYEAASDAAGFYRLPPIHRVAALELGVAHAAIVGPLSRTIVLDWGAAEQIEDFVVP